MGVKFSEDKSVITSKHFAIFQKMFSDAGAFAIRDAKERGLPITYVENNKIIKEYADGRKKVLGETEPWLLAIKRLFICRFRRKQSFHRELSCKTSADFRGTEWLW